MENNFKDELSWEEKAKINPLFAIMSDKIFDNSSTEFTNSELSIFYSQGERFWKRWMQPLLWDVKDVSNIRIAEFGCGMGRILNWAADAGMKATGIDISESQLEYAKRFCPESNAINFILLDKLGLIPSDNESFDIVYSYAVLQHIKESSALKGAISEMCRILKIGGKIKVQLRSQHTYLSRWKYIYFKSINFQNSSLCFYLRRTGPIYLPILRLNKHTNWKGACVNFSISSLIKLFNRNGIQVNQLEFDPQNKVVWITGTKNSTN